MQCSQELSSELRQGCGEGTPRAYPTLNQSSTSFSDFHWRGPEKSVFRIGYSSHSRSSQTDAVVDPDPIRTKWLGLMPTGSKSTRLSCAKI